LSFVILAGVFKVGVRNFCKRCGKGLVKVPEIRELYEEWDWDSQEVAAWEHDVEGFKAGTLDGYLVHICYRRCSGTVRST
jgi:hypothetical protein